MYSLEPPGNGKRRQQIEWLIAVVSLAAVAGWVMALLLNLVTGE